MSAFLLASGCTTTSTTPDQASLDLLSFTEPSKLLVVNCSLPGQVRRLGGKLTILTPRRPAKITTGECEIRGGEYVAHDRASLATSLNIWREQAMKGSAEAQTYMGEIYEKGMNVEPNYVKAAEWYRKAASQDYARAQMNLGYLYEKGLGVPQDKVIALSWYRKASGLTGDEVQYASSSDALRDQLESSREREQALTSQLQTAQQQVRQRILELEKKRKEAERQKSDLDRIRIKVQVRPAAVNVEKRQQELETREKELALLETKLASENRQLIQRASAVENEHVQLETQLQATRDREADLLSRLGGQQAEAGSLRQQLD
jgi:hypothetical protein